MISRPQRFIRAIHGILVVGIMLICMPLSAAWSQEEAAGELAMPPAAENQQPAEEQETPAAAASEAALAQPGTYTVVEGDTLWDISNAHYRDPFLWPLIWKANPAIEDPDLIYPGNQLVIPNLAPIERAMTAPEETAPPTEEEKAPPAQEEATAAPPPPVEPEGVPSFFNRKTVQKVGPEEPEEAASKLIVPEETRPTLVDKFEILSGGFVSDEPSEDKILSDVTDPSKSIMAYDDEVYISVKSRQDVKVGDLFLIYKPLHSVRHPITGKYYGKLNRVMGVLKVTEVRENGPDVARITRSFSSAEPGSLLAPFQKPEPLYANQEKRQKDISGYILEVTDRRTINGDVDVVYLDKGKIDGVEPGDKFSVISKPDADISGGQKTRKIPEKRAEIQVFLVKERTATAIVRQSTNAIARGDRIEYLN